MADTFIVHKEWLDNIAGLPIEQQDKVIGEFVRYGVGLDSAHSDDAVVQAFVNMLKGRIDYSKEKYQQKVDMSKTAGRKKKINDQQIYDLAKSGKSSTEIASILEVSKSAVDHSEGWKHRKESEFVF
jgi:hypothetical protein